MANQLTLTFCILVVSILTRAAPNCNNTLRYTLLHGSLIRLGSLNTSKNVFVFTIPPNPMNEVTFILDPAPLYVTGISIRHRFNSSELKDECISSFFPDPWASYYIQYTESETAGTHSLDYPPGASPGVINPSALFPYQEILRDTSDAEKLRVAITPTQMRTITIGKTIVQDDGQIYNAGTFCLQFELYGCENKPNDTNSLTLEYQMYMPEAGWAGSDFAYTGLCYQKTCTGGVGKLTDGQIVVALANNPDLFVTWELSAPVISVGARRLVLMKMLFILKDLYFIKEIQIIGAVKLAGQPYDPPISVTVNGIFVNTSDRIMIKDTYRIYLFPFIKTNVIQFQLYFEAPSNGSVRVALSEISIFKRDDESDESDYDYEQQSNDNNAPVIAVSVVASLLLALLAISLAVNLYLLIIRKNKEKGGNKHSMVHQMSHNDYIHTINTDIQLERFDTNYESIEFERSAQNYVKAPMAQESLEKLERKDRQNSTLIMPPNPTYIATLPLTPIEEVPGYSHLEHPHQAQPMKADSISKNNTLPRLRQKSASQVFTATERRKSFGGQHDLSDLK